MQADNPGADQGIPGVWVGSPAVAGGRVAAGVGMDPGNQDQLPADRMGVVELSLFQSATQIRDELDLQEDRW